MSQTLQIHVCPQKWLCLVGIPPFLWQIKKAQRPMKRGEFIPRRPGRHGQPLCSVKFNCKSCWKGHCSLRDTEEGQEEEEEKFRALLNCRIKVKGKVQVGCAAHAATTWSVRANIHFCQSRAVKKGTKVMKSTALHIKYSW